jgi:two-component system, NarL family, nitrate/nitrite response regulator NarL
MSIARELGVRTRTNAALNEYNFGGDPPNPSADRPVRVIVLHGRSLMAELLEHSINGQAGVTCVRSSVPNDWRLSLTSDDFDVAIWDLCSGFFDEAGTSGEDEGVWTFDLVADVLAEHSGRHFIVMIDAASPALAARLLTAGARGILSSEAGLNEIIAAVRAVALGELSVAPRHLRGVVHHLSAVGRRRRRVDDPPLTARQQSVVRMLADGKSTKEIAGTLGVTTNTARSHVQSILNRLNAHSRLEAVAKATSMGLV